MTAVIEAHGLTRRYGDLVAVDGLDFTVHQRECFGLLGPNGAGKTSTIRMICCTLPVTAGDLTVEGLDVKTSPRQVRSLLGVVPQEDNLDPDLTVLQNLLVYARYFDLAARLAQERARESLELFQLQHKRDSLIDTLSGGMKRRLLIARALLHAPRVLILDEPTTGLDPQARHLVWQKLHLLKAQGTTMLLSTHNMDEAAFLCDRLVIMDQGRILVEGAPSELLERYGGSEVVEVHPTLGDHDRVLHHLYQLGVDFQDSGDSFYVYSQDGYALTQTLAVDGARIVHRTANLEDVFLRLTGRALREE